jgi:hypothetical protein
MKEKFPTNLWRKRGLRTVFPVLLMASFMKALLNQIPKRKCSTISARHQATPNFHRLAMFLTVKNCTVCMYLYILCCDTF